MKNSKYYRSIAIILALLLALSGCGGKKDDVTTPETTKESTPAESTATATPEITNAPETPQQTPETTEAAASETTIPETTAPETTAPETSVAETVTESTPEETMPETEPPVEFNISYDLDGGIDGGNPTVHNSGEALKLIAPIRPGYDFLGWTGSGLDTPTVSYTVPAGNKEALTFKANWAENTYVAGEIELDKTHFGKDDGLTAAEGGLPVSKYDTEGSGGEGVYILKTVYTDVAIDGDMDAAYTYGVHVYGDLYYEEYLYGSREKTVFDLYLIRTQNGNICGYMDVTDPDVEVNETLFGYLPHHCDSIDFYYEIDNGRSGYEMFSFVADPTGKFVRGTPPTHKVKLTDKGYAVEFTFDKNGEPFMNNDELGFGVYINDCFDYNSNSDYKKAIVKHTSKLNPHSAGYLFPDGNIHDALRMSTDSASGRVDTSTDKEDLSGDILTDAYKNNARVAVIYDDNATAQTILNARALCDLLRRSGVNADAVCESKMMADYDCEILFGMTDREESAELIGLLNYGGYGVSVRGDTIAAIGWTEEAAKASYDLIYEIIEHGILDGSGSDLGIYLGTTSLSGCDKLPMLDGFDSVTDAGEGAYSVYKLDSGADGYEAYIKKLEAAGYTFYTSRSVGSVQFATYYDDETVVSVQYGGAGDGSLRVVAEPKSNTALPSLEKPEVGEAVCTPSVTMIDCTHAGNMCFIIQLSNGNFIIVDSGNNGYNWDIYKILREKAPDRNNIVIDAWIITHFHQDHMGGFVDYTGLSSYMRYTTIKSVIYNFPANQVLSTAAHSPTDMNNVKLFYENRKPAMTQKGTVFYQARTGQKYYFGDAEVEILWTYEDIMPFNVFIDRSNPTCIGFSVTVAGQKIIFTGDSSGEEFTMAYKKYGDYLKSDFVQLSHHGQGDGYSPVEFYRAVGAPYVFNPGIGDYYGVGEAWARDNAKKYFMRGTLGRCTVTLPYDGGAFESTRGQ